jgi:hypothetical protein
VKPPEPTPPDSWHSSLNMDMDMDMDMGKDKDLCRQGYIVTFRYAHSESRDDQPLIYRDLTVR